MTRKEKIGLEIKSAWKAIIITIILSVGVYFMSTFSVEFYRGTETDVLDCYFQLCKYRNETFKSLGNTTSESCMPLPIECDIIKRKCENRDYMMDWGFDCVWYDLKDTTEDVYSSSYRACVCHYLDEEKKWFK